jgi:D-3-phosphoglycerate dehydrogenase
MATVLITTSSFGDKGIGQITARGLTVVSNPRGRKLTAAEVSELIDVHRPVGMIAGVEPLTRSVLANADGLRVISRCGIGLDSVDLDAAKDFGIVVTNTPDAPTIPVAELALGMILALLRGIHISDAGIRRGAWERPMGSLLHGKTVGIVGCGRIGARLAQLLQPFGCQVLGCDPVATSAPWYELVGLERLLADADIVSLHLPYTEETHHFIGAHQLRAMKRGAVIVNAARGGLVDEAALCEALQSGHLAGAALDCFETEPYLGPLRDLPNVVLTGHIGSYAKEARALMEAQAVENLLRELPRAGSVKGA